MNDVIGLYDTLLPELVKSQAHRWGYVRTLSEEEVSQFVANNVRTNTNAQDDLRFVLTRVAEIFDLERCSSEFCAPGTDKIIRCAGRAGHVGTVMHGGDNAAWGDNAGVENYPAERIMIKLSRVHNMLVQALATARVLKDQAEEFAEIVDERDVEIARLNRCLDEAVRRIGSDFLMDVSHSDAEATQTSDETGTNEHDQGKFG